MPKLLYARPPADAEEERKIRTSPGGHSPFSDGASNRPSAVQTARLTRSTWRPLIHAHSPRAAGS
jgi:hypothetical protein